LSPKEIPYIKR